MYATQGLSSVSQYYKSSLGDATFRNYRRGLADYARLLQLLKIEVESISDFDTARRISSSVFDYAYKENWNVMRMKTMKTAVAKLFTAVFGCDFTNVPLVRDILTAQVNRQPPKKERLSLKWKLENLIDYLKSRPRPLSLSFSELTAVAIVHLMAFKSMRFSEIFSLSPSDTSPTDEGWKFWLVVKGHRVKESICIFPAADGSLDTLGTLIELRNRLRSRLCQQSDSIPSFWYKEEGTCLVRMTYNEVRGAAKCVLEAAGINEHRPYHIKHATLTFLAEQNVPHEEVTAFARHSYGSMASRAFYTSWDDGRALSNKFVSVTATDFPCPTAPANGLHVSRLIICCVCLVCVPHWPPMLYNEPN
jgi:hypothetical protein